MKFVETSLSGAFELEPTPFVDERGSFARVFCTDLFRDHGLCNHFVQVNHTRTELAGTIRGLHYQIPPAEEVKLFRCVKGEVFDVIVDMRSDSSTFLNWHGVVLSEQNQKSIYVPAGFAHGFQTLTPACEVTYQSSAAYSPEHERQIRFDDPRIAIDWKPLEPTLSHKDATTPMLDESFTGVALTQ